MNVDVLVETTIRCRPEVVAAFAGDPTNAPRWYANITSVQWRTPPPLGTGSRVDFEARFLGRRLAYTYEIVEMSERRLVMRTADGPFPMETTYAWEPVGERVHTHDAAQPRHPSGFTGLAAPCWNARCAAPPRRTWRGSRRCSRPARQEPERIVSCRR